MGSDHAGSAVTAPRVDAHAHVFTAEMPLSAEAWSRPAKAFTAQDFLATLDRHGVERGVIAAATLYGDYNDYTLETLAAAPRLRATVIVQPQIDPGRLREMAACGVVGVRLGIRRARIKPDLWSPEYRRLMMTLADLGLHVEVLAQGSQMPTFLPPIEASGVNIVVDHLGLPDEADGVAGPGYERLLKSIEGGRTWVKLSASFRTPWPTSLQAAQRLMAVAGPDHLLWGSDAPFIGHEDIDYPQALDRLFRLVPDAAARTAIDETSMRLFFSPSGASR